MKFCSECGEKLLQTSKFCSSCGKKLESDYKDITETLSLTNTNAPSSKRLINFLIDNIIGSVASLLILSFFLGFFGLLTGDEGDDVWTAISILAVFCYYFICELSGGKTLGKFLTKTKVVMINGDKPTTIAILKRTLVRFIPFEAFSFFGDYPRGLHDKWSGTKVVIDK